MRMLINNEGDEEDDEDDGDDDDDVDAADDGDDDDEDDEDGSPDRPDLIEKNITHTSAPTFGEIPALGALEVLKCHIAKPVTTSPI
jgi:hypothetical protein